MLPTSSSSAAGDWRSTVSSAVFPSRQGDPCGFEGGAAPIPAGPRPHDLCATPSLIIDHGLYCRRPSLHPYSFHPALASEYVSGIERSPPLISNVYLSITLQIAHDLRHRTHIINHRSSIVARCPSAVERIDGYDSLPTCHVNTRRLQI